MALDVDRDRQGRDMTWIGGDFDRKGGRFSAEAHGPDTETVDGITPFFLKVGVIRIGMDVIDRTHECLFGDQSGLLEVSTDSDSDGQRRTRFPAGLENRVKKKVFHAFGSL
jgi:hypothetical protein